MATAKEVRSHPQWVQERRLRGWSQTKLAEVIGADRRSVNRWENGDGFPSPYFCEHLCEVFGKNAEELGLIRPDIGGIREEPGINGDLRTRESPSPLRDKSLSGTASSHYRINFLLALPLFLRIGLIGMIVIVVIGTLSWRLIFQPDGKFSPSTSSTTATANVQQSPQEIYHQETSKAPVVNDPLTGQVDNSWNGNPTATHGCAMIGGAYHAYASISYVTECYLHTVTFRDYALQVQMTVLDGDAGGLIFGTDGINSEEYRFAVYSGLLYPRYYDVFLPLEGTRSVMGFSSNIIPDLGQPNLLTVIVHESTTYLYVNGQYVNQFHIPNNTVFDGKIGVFATNRQGDSTNVVFRDLKVWT